MHITFIKKHSFNLGSFFPKWCASTTCTPSVTPPKVILGDFNLKPTDPLTMTFLNEHDLINLIKNNTYFKGEGSCIVLILTNRKYSFKNSTSFETSLSDHYHLIYSMLKTTFDKEEPKTLIYCDYKIFCLETFKTELFSKLESQANNDYQTFEKNFVDTLNNQTPKKSKILAVTRSLILIRL